MHASGTGSEGGGTPPAGAEPHTLSGGQRHTPPAGAEPHNPSGAEPHTSSGGVDREFLALERELAVFLRRARAQSGEMAREVHPELEPAAYGLFVRLDDAGPQRATELAGYFGVGKATMSRQLRALEDLGLVARDPDPADGRASLVRLTEEGRNRFRHVRDARRERYVRKLADWDRAEVAELARLLNHFNVRSEG
ncbi:MarR family transcriptional regulator [Streptomyces sp. NBC_01077]|uniref:MarR family winged helix-turn-helix transcriptional regulator n=1 Tax=Streptomyces sp. NBC_01077 TaxID=2903746 RepID=UPI00386670E2|nr:MarR family transcriptional regulator [Streptomyces sp. NBC_01077]